MRSATNVTYAAPWRERILAAALLLLPLLWFCREPVFLGRVFEFRDAVRFYYPLFEWTSHEWQSGRVPLWNSRENLGTPILADASASVFYPGQLPFHLPGPHAWKFNAYIISHLFLCQITTYRLSRAWRFRRGTACMTANAYAFCGAVLFNDCNVPFLVSAAWLPLGFLKLDQLVRQPTWRSACSLGVVLALMTLGGDPQTAYHLGLMSALGVFGFTPHSALRTPHSALRIPARRLGLVGTVALASLGLSAVQWIPSAEWAAHSERAAKSGAHEQNIYHFSVGPWRFAEFLWPNFFGRMFPENSRWATAIPAEGRVWTPSLYCGLVPFLCAMTAWRCRRGSRRRRWLTWIMVLSLLASLGWFGLGWRGPVGGVYWWLVALAPGYAYFRYPAKWLVVTSLCVALLSGSRVEQLTQRRKLPKLGAFLPFVVITGCVGCMPLLMPTCTAWMRRAPDDPLFGPLDVGAGIASAYWGLGQSFFILGACLFLWMRFDDAQHRRWFLALITIVDLTLAHSWLVRTVRLDEVTRPSLVANTLREIDGPVDGGSAAVRVYRPPDTFSRPHWNERSSPDRLVESLRGDIDTLFLRTWLRSTEPIAISMLESHGSIWHQEYRVLLREVDAHPEILRLLGTHYVVAPSQTNGDQTSLDATLFEPVGEWPAETTGWDMLRVRNPLPRSYLLDTANRSCEIIDETPQCVEIECDAERPSVLVLSDLDFPGWEASVRDLDTGTDWQAVPIERVNRVMRSVKVGTGRQRVRFVYRPWTFRWGASISLVSWVLVGGLLFRRRSHGTRPIPHRLCGPFLTNAVLPRKKG